MLERIKERRPRRKKIARRQRKRGIPRPSPRPRGSESELPEPAAVEEVVGVDDGVVGEGEDERNDDDGKTGREEELGSVGEEVEESTDALRLSSLKTLEEDYL